MKKIFKRKPDIETETFRAWTPNKKERKNLEKEKGIKIKFKGQEYELTGFNYAKNKGKIVFAWKYKHRDKVILYYIPDKLTNKDRKRIEGLFSGLIPLSKMLGYEAQDLRISLENINIEKHLF